MFEDMYSEQNSSKQTWTTSSLAELIDHIICFYHRPLQSQLPRVITMAEDLADLYENKIPEVGELLQIFRNFSYELELHMHMEEMVLFPAIVNIERNNGQGAFGCGAGIDMPISVMMQDHEKSEDDLLKIQELCKSLNNTLGSSDSFSLLAHSIEHIHSEMQEHVQKENEFLFPRTMTLVTKTMLHTKA